MSSRRHQLSGGPGLLLNLPWWYRPSRFLLGVSLPALLLFANADSTLSLSSAQLFYGSRDTVLGILAILVLAAGALLGETGVFSRLVPRHWVKSGNQLVEGTRFHGRISEAFLTEKFDKILLVVFLVSHLIFFRGFFLNPGMAMSVLGGDVELKHTFKTIPGVTTWTQVSLVLAALRGLRWGGVLPGNVKLISAFHLVFFGTLFIRAMLWSERLALIEGVVPFFLCALPKVIRLTGPWMRTLMKFFPLIVPVLLLVVFTVFEYFRSWQYYGAQHGSLFQFGWLRLFTYYFEAMNTGSATLGISGFYDGLTFPISEDEYEYIYKGLYLASLDVEFNNPSGIWYLATYTGNVLFFPLLAALGAFYGVVWKAFREGRIFGLFFPINFLGLMEIIRIHYWFGTNRVVPTTLVICLLVVWAVFLPRRLRFRSRPSLDPSSVRPAP
ncbi:MAG: hypothetical protein P1U86_21565 [Verrucomicrobiales bacterium]|nr:hypothetical protein [Verrucomicrobiales bacterium]